MKKTIRVSSKLIILSVVPLFIFSSIIYICLTLSTERHLSAQQTLEQRLSQTQRLNLIIRTFNSKIIDTAHKARSGMALWEDAQKQISQGKKVINQQWQAYQQGMLSNQEVKLLKSIKPLYAKSLVAIKTIADYVNKASSYGMSNYVDLQMYAEFEPLLSELDKLVLLQKKLAHTDSELNAQLTQRTNQLVLVIIGVIAILILLLGWSIYQSISKPLKHLQQTMDQVEQDSNLSLRVELDRQDELGEIGQSFNVMMSRIVGFVNELADIGKTLDSATEHTISACQMAKEQVSHTQNELSNANSSMEQMTQTVEITQQHTENTIALSKEADNHANNNFEVVEKSSVQIKSLAEAIESSAQQMNDLREHGQQINSVLTVIKAVAEQTNLLALNAAIEAARAGEQGRGFAVVADEVRSLAQRTQESTGEIETVISNIRRSTDEVASQMKTNADFANQGAQTIKESESNLQVIMESFSEIVSKNEQINHNQSEQLHVVKGVKNMMNNVFTLSQQSQNNTDEVLDNAKVLENLSISLKTALMKFRY